MSSDPRTDARTDTRVDAYIAAAAPFAVPILSSLRATVRAACPDAVETIRWQRPTFLYRDRPLAGMAAFKRHCVFGLWDGVALTPGQDDPLFARLDRIESLADLPPPQRIADAIRQAMLVRDAGERPRRAPRVAKPEAEVPPALAAALADDAAASATFAAFSPSCRREYCEWIAEAKRDATRDKRVAEALAMLRAGKRRNWKYENC